MSLLSFMQENPVLTVIILLILAEVTIRGFNSLVCLFKRK